MNQLPSTIRSNFKNILQLSEKKDIPISNSIIFSATSNVDNQKCTIRLLNQKSELYKKDRDLAITLYLKELFYLSARFGAFAEQRCNLMVEDKSSVIDFRNFVVERDSIAFVMKEVVMLNDLILMNQIEKGKSKIDISKMLKDVYSSLRYIHSEFSVLNIDIRLDNIFAIRNSQKKEDFNYEYFVGDWASEALDTSNNISTFDLDQKSSALVERIQVLERNDQSRKYVAPENLRLRSTFKSQRQTMASEIFALGLIALEAAGLDEKSWKTLSAIEDPKKYEMNIEMIIQQFSEKRSLGSQPKRDFIEIEGQHFVNNSTLSEPHIVAAMLKKDPAERLKDSLELLNIKTISDSLCSEVMQPILKRPEIIAEKIDEDKALVEEEEEKYQIIQPGKTISKDNDIYIDIKEVHPDIRELIENSQSKDVEEIDLHSKSLMDIDAVALIANATTWKNLKKLLLYSNLIGDKGIIAIGSSTCWKNLRVLDLARNKLGDEGCAAIGRNKTWSYLELLYLNKNEIGDKGAIAIGSNTTWKNLLELSFGFNKIGDEGAKAIGSNSTWVYLEELCLYHNDIGDEGAIAIASNNTWHELKWFYMWHNPRISDTGKSALKSSKLFGSIVNFEKQNWMK